LKELSNKKKSDLEGFIKNKISLYSFSNLSFLKLIKSFSYGTAKVNKFKKQSPRCRSKIKISSAFTQKSNNGLFTSLQFFLFYTKNNVLWFYLLNKFELFKRNSRLFETRIRDSKKKLFGDGFLYCQGLLIIFFLDSLVTDDEPLWEPIEWSLMQTWILFIFVFAWIAENLITSRFGSYTGRDKRVWFAWYKTFWLIELWYILSLGAASLFVITPFYNELTYSVPFVFSWWNWYNRIFFFKFIGSYTIVLALAHVLQLNLRHLNWKKNFLLMCLILIFLLYLLYTQFVVTFFSYFTDPLWYQKTRFVDYVQLSHEPLKWGWGSSKRDHFTYHKVSTVFWFKNDGPFAASFLLLNLFFFFTIFGLNLYWITLLRKTYALKEISFTFTTYCTSALKQFFFFFFLFYVLIIVSFIVSYWRFPIEFAWVLNQTSWLSCFLNIVQSYFYFLIKIIS